MLKQHISIAGVLVAAAKANDKAKMTAADKRWHDNAAEIATFLSGANPDWTCAALLDLSISTWPDHTGSNRTAATALER